MFVPITQARFCERVLRLALPDEMCHDEAPILREEAHAV
jgi:hypothetical protein